MCGHIQPRWPAPARGRDRYDTARAAAARTGCHQRSSPHCLHVEFGQAQRDRNYELAAVIELLLGRRVAVRDVTLTVAVGVPSDAACEQFEPHELPVIDAKSHGIHSLLHLLGGPRELE
jgi:hypothetical protein